jgi:hypothetical protein
MGSKFLLLVFGIGLTICVASSIAAADWDACRIPFTTKTSHAKRNRGDLACRERHITFSSHIACGFAETETRPQKSNDGAGC